ncbi:hypothetical protein NEAUS03_0489 [Nematocida ausubeli]|nr:hypothetical protein NEAUS03_0489 [Nematocida ausubeli]
MASESGAVLITPFEAVMNKDTGHGEIVLRNVTKSSYAFKIKTTHPTSYKVRPTIGIIEGGKSQIIVIEIIDPHIEQDLSTHKFLFQFAEMAQELKTESLRQIFLLKGVKIIEQRVSIRYSSPLVNQEISDSKAQEESPFVVAASVFIIYSTLVLFRNLLFGI